MATSQQIKRRWRFYRTPAGRRVIDEFLATLSDFDAAEVAAALKEVRDTEGAKSRILLGLHAMPKRTQKTPEQHIRKAERRLSEWRQRGNTESGHH